MHGMLETDRGFTLMGADTPPGMDVQRRRAISISLSGDDADELRGYWQKLSDGGTVTVPLEKQMWGDEFGMCTDQFGIGWMVNIAGAAGLSPGTPTPRPTAAEGRVPACVAGPATARRRR